MSEMKVEAAAMTPWTPGPWNGCGGGSCTCKTVTCADYPVAKITNGDWGDAFAAVRLAGNGPLDFKAEAYMERYTYGTVNEQTATANVRLIAQAPIMADYIQQRADAGDADAIEIMRKVRDGVRYSDSSSPSVEVRG